MRLLAVAEGVWPVNNMASLPPCPCGAGDGCPPGPGIPGGQPHVRRGKCVVQEADAAALVADVLLALGLRGHDVKVTHANGPRLVRLGALMLAEFGVGTAAESTEEGNG